MVAIPDGKKLLQVIHGLFEVIHWQCFASNQVKIQIITLIYCYILWCFNEAININTFEKYFFDFSAKFELIVFKLTVSDLTSRLVRILSVERARSRGIVLSLSIVYLLVWLYLSRVLLDLLHTCLGSIPKIKYQRLVHTTCRLSGKALVLKALNISTSSIVMMLVWCTKIFCCSHCESCFATVIYEDEALTGPISRVVFSM